MSKNSTVKAALIHLLIWIIWQFLQSLSLFETWHLSNKIILAYNYISIIIVFYTVHYLAISYFKKLSYSVFVQLNILNRIYYLLCKWQVLVILTIILSYIFGSWIIDKYVFHLDYQYFYIYCTGRWNVEAFYVVVGIALSYYFEYAKRQERKSKAKDERIINLQEYINRKNGEQDAALQRIFNMLAQMQNKQDNGSN